MLPVRPTFSIRQFGVWSRESGVGSLESGVWSLESKSSVASSSWVVFGDTLLAHSIKRSSLPKADRSSRTPILECTRGRERHKAKTPPPKLNRGRHPENGRSPRQSFSRSPLRCLSLLKQRHGESDLANRSPGSGDRS